VFFPWSNAIVIFEQVIYTRTTQEVFDLALPSFLRQRILLAMTGHSADLVHVATLESFTTSDECLQDLLCMRRDVRLVLVLADMSHVTREQLNIAKVGRMLRIRMSHAFLTSVFGLFGDVIGCIESLLRGRPASIGPFGLSFS
jgi:hypothetical protein